MDELTHQQPSQWYDSLRNEELYSKVEADLKGKNLLSK
jgi:hypothetical protein